MKFIETPLKGAYLIELDPQEDERGFFARSFCEKEFKSLGLETSWVQCNISYNHKRGTLRGLHYQSSPHEEAKIVRCVKGAIHDVIVDLREGSVSYKKNFSIYLSSSHYKQLYIPKGFAHGFQTLEDHTEVFYQMSEFYFPQSAAGLRWNDPLLNIEWPLEEKIVSQKDNSYPLLLG